MTERPPTVQQRAVLVLPTTAEFDSRTYRIASSLVARGHAVTVLARWRPSLPERESHPAGYEIVRVKVSAGHGLPLPGPVYRLISQARQRRRERAARAVKAANARTEVTRARTEVTRARTEVTRATTGGADSPAVPPVDDANAVAVPVVPPVDDANVVAAPAVPPVHDANAVAAPQPAQEPADPDAAPAPRRRGPLARIRALPAGIWRVAAIALVVRSQTKASRSVAPAADLYHGMAYMGIPVALDLGRRHHGRTVYDARDIYVDAGNLARLPRPARAVVGRLERGWARRADRVITVNRPYAEVMADRFGVELPLIVLNCSYRYDPPRPGPRLIHEALALPPETRVVLYQGGFSRDRGIEQLIQAIPAVNAAVLVLLGYGSLQAELERQAADPATNGRLRILPAVPPTELLAWVASADVVTMPIQPTTLNHRLTTPNKLFEAMAAGVPVVASDLPGMAGIVRETGAGELVDPTDPAAIAAAITRILDAPPDERAAYGERALAGAHATYNWERQMDLLLDEYSRLTARPW